MLEGFLLNKREGNILEFKNEVLLLKGLLDGKRAFCGPEIVQFDITNRCNNNCLCCWNNSPLLGRLSRKERRKRQKELPLNLIKRVIRELGELGTRTLFFAGGGEPFMHPNFMEILRYAKNSGLRTVINTNFTLINEGELYDLVDLKIDFIHVSILAGTAKTYALIHPNKTEKDFYRIKEALKFLAYIKDIKKAWNPPYPHINMYYVIFNKNYHEIKEMVDLALEVRANSLEFVPIDVIHGKTDVLLLNSHQLEIAKDEISQQMKRLNNLDNGLQEQVTFIQHGNRTLERFSSKSAEKGEYELNLISGLPCYTGWVFARILANGNVNPCLKAHRISIGNVYRDSFKRIWNSRKQRVFRKKAFNLVRNKRYFKRIGNISFSSFGCLKSCDNIEMNIEMHERFRTYLNFNS